MTITYRDDWNIKERITCPLYFSKLDATAMEYDPVGMFIVINDKDLQNTICCLADDMASMLMETINNMLIEMYATFAHAEMQKKEKRQREGIQAIKERGEWGKYARPKAIDFEEFRKTYQKVVDGELKSFECM